MKAIQAAIDRSVKAAVREARIDELAMALETTGVALVAGVPIKSLEGAERSIDPNMLRVRKEALGHQREEGDVPTN